jgi:hypothetical protein
MPKPSTRLHTIACTCDRCRPLTPRQQITPRQQMLVRASLGAIGLLTGALIPFFFG